MKLDIAQSHLDNQCAPEVTSKDTTAVNQSNNETTLVCCLFKGATFITIIKSLT